MPLYIVSCLSLSIVAAISAAGLLSKHFQENLFQNIGMFILMVASMSRAMDIWNAGMVPWDWTALHIALALYATGTAWKVYMHTIKDRIAASAGWRPHDIEVRPWDSAVALVFPDRRRKPR